jgi:hypothetical protein
VPLPKDEEEKEKSVNSYVKKKLKLKPNFWAENVTGLFKSTKSNETWEMLEVKQTKTKNENNWYGVKDGDAF